MANTFLNPSVIAKEVLAQLANNTVMGRLVFRGYEEEFKTRVNGWKKGSSVTIKAPIQSRVKDGQTIDVVDIREEDVTFTVDTWKHIAHKFTGTEMSLNIDAFSERFIKPDIQALGNYIDSDILSLYKGIPNQVGTPGSTPSSWYTIAEASAVMADHAVPQNDRYLVIDQWAQAKLCDQMKGVFINSMAQNAIEKAKLPPMAGFEMFMSQNINTHTCGTAAGLTTNLVDDTVAEGDVAITIDQNGSWSNTLTQGDIFTVASVNGVNPISGTSTGRLRQFVVEAAAGTTGNETEVSCTPGVAPWNIYSASATEKTLPYQTVDALPANNAAVTVAGTASLVHKVNLAFHKNCLGLVMVPIEPLMGLKSYTETDPDTGFTVTITLGGDIINYVNYFRADILYGKKILNPFMGCRVAG